MVFSVVIPTYDRPHLLRRALESVLGQTYQNFEVVVSDDCSPQPALDVVAPFGDERIRVVRSETNRGNAGARNAGVQAALGEWVAFLDDDDEMLPHHLEEAARVLRAVPQETGFAWSGVEHVRGDGEDYTVVKTERWHPEYRDREHAYLSLIQGRHVGTSTGFLVRRSAAERIGGFDERLRAAVDTDFIIRLAEHYDFVVLPTVSIRMYEHSGARVRHNFEAVAEAYAIIMEKHADILLRHSDVRAALLFKRGRLRFLAGDPRAGRPLMTEALRLRPGWIKGWATFSLYALAPGLQLHLGLSRVIGKLRNSLGRTSAGSP